MALELESPKPRADPIAPADLAAGMLLLSATAKRLERTVGAEAHDGKPALGLCGKVADLAETIGRAPNDATGDPGCGLCAVVAGLAKAHTAHSRKVVAGATLATGGVVAVIEIVLQLLKALS